MFERLAREIHAISMHHTHMHMQGGQLTAVKVQKPERGGTSPTASPHRDAARMIKPKGLSGSKFMEHKSHTVSQKHAHASKQPVFKRVADEKVTRGISEDHATADKTLYGDIDGTACSFIDSSFFSFFSDVPLDSPFFRLALDCYTGLSCSLLARADKIAAAIRQVERKFNVSSVLSIAQRRGNDFSDLGGHLRNPKGTSVTSSRKNSGTYYCINPFFNL